MSSIKDNLKSNGDAVFVKSLSNGEFGKECPEEDNRINGIECPEGEEGYYREMQVEGDTKDPAA